MQLLNDLTHYISADLNVGATGDLQTSYSIERGKQRILRRLLTNPGEYIFHPEYGAGLPGYIGLVTSISKIESLIKGQVLLEECVAKTPPPIVTVKQTDAVGTMQASIRYTDAISKNAVVLTFNVDK